MDDFTGGFCKTDSFPIISSVRDELENNFHTASAKKLTILKLETFKSNKLIPSVIIETKRPTTSDLKRNIISATKQTSVSILTNLTVIQSVD